MQSSQLIQHLHLLPHPEGGYYLETYRSEEVITTRHGQRRHVCTSIYYLLENTDKSHFHRIQSDELWYFHQGQPLEILYIEHGELHSVLLGNEVEHGAVPSFCVRAGLWFAARVKDGKGAGLVSCTVSPGFDFADFELAKRSELVSEFPTLKEVIEEFTRE
ncbi:MAG: cupin domain-containing protein [Bacteroidetes bacterium]|nr:cupin domain-containing protein [Bacteroidota bacterium]